MGCYDLYNGMPPHNGTDTSIAAAESISEVSSALRAQVFDWIRACGKDGATCDEIEVGLGLRHQTASARIRELVLKNRTVDSAARRLTRSARLAIVWVEQTGAVRPPAQEKASRNELLAVLRLYDRYDRCTCAETQRLETERYH